jgi:TolB protein
MKRTPSLVISLMLAILPVTLIADDNAQSPGPRIGRLAASKILFLGNSITLHGPAPAIGWTGNWGMAASAEHLDYVHLLTADIAAASGEQPTVMVKNIADFERGHIDYDVTNGLKSELEFQADIVVVAIGENVSELTTDDAKEKFAKAFSVLLGELRQHGQPAIFVRSSFWSNLAKDSIMQNAARDAGATFVDIATLGSDASNMARSERQIEHAGVAAHPGDKGMKSIADAILAAIRQEAKLAVSRDQLIGYTQFQTTLPGGRHANVRTMRAHVVSTDGSANREIAAELVSEPDAWTQFAGWSPDGETAVIARGWQSPENAAIEEERQGFHFTPEGWQLDSYLVDLATNESRNVTSVDRVSFYNGGLFFWPGDASKLGFTALIDGNSHPFRMDRDGRNKTDLTKGSQQFTYGFSSSRDGRRVAYHMNYQIYLADADGANAMRIETGQPFNFGPTWSPDGELVLFVSGEHYNCHPYIVRADGSGLKKLADRGGYRGVVEFLDVPDFHGGSSDTPVWAVDSQSIFYTAVLGPCIELFSVRLDGQNEQLTKSEAETLHYHPQPSADGRRLLYGCKRNGIRQICLMNLADHSEKTITSLTTGHAAMWPHWQPVVAEP